MPQDHYLSARQVHIYCRENHLSTSDICGLALEYTIQWGVESDSRSGLIDNIRSLLWDGVEHPYKTLSRDEALLELEGTPAEDLDQLFSDLQSNPNL